MYRNQVLILLTMGTDFLSSGVCMGSWPYMQQPGGRSLHVVLD